MLLKIITVSCLVVAVSGASFQRSPRNLQQSPSQLEAQALPAPNSEATAKAAAQQAKLHYVEIDPSLKGNYKFGYDTGSGPAGQSFREETRLDDGTVKGAYGYVDANGKQRIVKYTAGKAGFVVEGDQEAASQGGSQAAPARQQEAAPAEPRRPQPVSLPQQPAQPTFDEQPQQFNRAAPAPAQQAAENRAHAEQLRQHQLATQEALAQQQRLAQQLQLQQQQILAAQRQQQPQQPQQQQQQQQQFAAPQPQPQLQHPQQPPQFQPQPQHRHAHIVDPQSGSFFSSSTDGNLQQLLAQQMRHFQQPGNQFAHQQQQPSFGAQAAPSFQQAAPQFAPQPQDFSLVRAARQAQPQHFQQQQQPSLSPQSALAALQQQQQQDAQMLAALRAQQLARLQQESRQASRAAPQQQQQQHQQQQFEQPQQQFQAQAQPQQQAFAPQPIHRGPSAQSLAPQQQAAASAAAPAVAVQPDNFGPPVIDIRTLNYSIGQQTRV